MSVSLHPEANDELVTSSEWYERQKPGLGGAFASEVFRALDVLEEEPETWPEWPGLLHAPPIRRFLRNH
jgi:hypothetical protein